MSSTPATTEEAQPKKKKPLLLLIVAVVVLALGGGGGYFFLKRGHAGETETAEKEKEKKPTKKKKAAEEEEEEEESEEEAPTAGHAEEHAEGEKGSTPVKSKFSVKRLNLPDDKDVKKVIELQPFVINLADKDASHYLRLTVSIGIGETKEEKPDPLLVTRVRNALLAVLTSKTSEEVLSEQGKATLRKELLKAARAAVEEPTIEAIYVTDFIVQM
jgi:flagellar FliL protein